MEERIAGANGVPLQRVKKDPRIVGKEKQRRFLEHLAATCNVKASARAAGASVYPFYGLRQRDAAFAAAWKEALAAAYDRLEEALVAKALAEVEPMEFDMGAVETVLVDEVPGEEEGSTAKRGHRTPGSGIGGRVALVDVQLALALLNRRQAAERSGRPRHGLRRATAEEVEKAINAKLDKLAGRVGGEG
jgi:hypothetical protein